MTISRREFLGAGAAAAASVTLSKPLSASTFVSAVERHSPVQATSAGRPVVIASANGIRGVAKAYDMIARQNADTLDAIIAGVNIQELDPEDQSVGLGGLPNEEGVVQLDACCMHGPTKRAGAVAALEDIATAITRCESSDGLHRSHPARWRRREKIRARDGIQGAEPAHRKEPAGLAQMESRVSTTMTTGSITPIQFRSSSRPARST